MAEDRQDEGQPGGAGGGTEGPRISPLLLRMFGTYAERYLARQFHAVRLSRGARPEGPAARGRPLIVYLTHPSWWDPLVCLAIANATVPDRRHYAPIEAEALARYPFFERLGFFGIESGTA